MAEAVESKGNVLKCGICWDLLKDPATLNCGHIFCMDCVKERWNRQGQTGVYSCPECNQTFSQRPNSISTELVEQMTTPKTQTTPPMESTNDPKQLGQTQRRFQQRVEEREKELQELRKAVETLKRSAQVAVEDCERIFTDMISSIERRRSEVKELIRAQEKTDVSRAEGLLKRLEQEIAELKKRDAEQGHLAYPEDHIHFIKDFQSVTDLPHIKTLSNITVRQAHSFEALKVTVSTLKEQLEDFIKREFMKIAAAVSNVPSFRSSVPSVEVSKVPAFSPKQLAREDFLQYSCTLTLDPNTANKYLHLSEGNRKVTFRVPGNSYPDHPDRFDGCCQVLCRESVSGRCYWEVEWSGDVDIAVSYKSISRKGGGAECGFGCNKQTWRLILSRSRPSFFLHNNKDIKLPLVVGSRIGVYVNHREGILAFYDISETMTLLHTVQTTFAQTLYPGFGLDTGSSVKLLS